MRFTPSRQTHFFGTKEHIYGDSEKIWRFDFLNGNLEVTDTNASGGMIDGGHGGGDTAIMEHFLNAVHKQDPSLILSGPDETRESHLMVFAVEQARQENRVVTMHPDRKTPDQ